MVLGCRPSFASFQRPWKQQHWLLTMAITTHHAPFRSMDWGKGGGPSNWTFDFSWILHGISAAQQYLWLPALRMRKIVRNWKRSAYKIRKPSWTCSHLLHEGRGCVWPKWQMAKVCKAKVMNQSWLPETGTGHDNSEASQSFETNLKPTLRLIPWFEPGLFQWWLCRFYRLDKSDRHTGDNDQRPPPSAT